MKQIKEEETEGEKKAKKTQKSWCRGKNEQSPPAFIEKTIKALLALSIRTNPSYSFKHVRAMDNVFVVAYAALAPGPAHLFKRHDKQLLFIHSVPSADELFDCRANVTLGIVDESLPGMHPDHKL